MSNLKHLLYVKKIKKIRMFYIFINYYLLIGLMKILRQYCINHINECN